MNERVVSPKRKEDPEVTGRKPKCFKKKGSGPKKKKEPKTSDSQLPQVLKENLEKIINRFNTRFR
jgi:hypothetical protein